jgi:methylase of polypeptide subunit release factors
VEPLTGEVFRMPHETELWDTHVLFYRHRIFSSPSCGSFFDLPSIRFYRRIARKGLDWLSEGGALYFEINRAYGAETVRMLEELGYRQIELRKDLSGNDRMIKAIRP